MSTKSSIQIEIDELTKQIDSLITIRGKKFDARKRETKLQAEELKKQLENAYIITKSKRKKDKTILKVKDVALTDIDYYNFREKGLIIEGIGISEDYNRLSFHTYFTITIDDFNKQYKFISKEEFENICKEIIWNKYNDILNDKVDYIPYIDS